MRALLTLLFRVFLDDDRFELTRKILIATGVKDQLLALPRIEEFWGKICSSMSVLRWLGTSRRAGRRLKQALARVWKWRAR